MTRSKNLSGLPHPNPTPCYWQTPPHPISDCRTSPELPAATQYVIVGSGITGVSVAYKLLQRNANTNIVMLEAGKACSRSSGRNGGHCRFGNWKQFKINRDKFGKEDAMRVWELEKSCVKNMTDEIKLKGIECDVEAVETVDVLADEDVHQRFLDAFYALKEAYPDTSDNPTIKHWSAKETEERFLMPKMAGSFSYPGLTDHPYKLTCGLLETALGRGLNLQTHTPVTNVQQSGEFWAVQTHRGIIIAKNVILATNAYTAALYEPLGNFIKPVRSQVVAVRPGSNITGNEVLRKTICPMYATAEDYSMIRAEGLEGAGDFIYCGGPSESSLDDSKLDPASSNYLINACRTWFGKENWGENGTTLQQWSGILAETTDKHPVVGQAPGPRGLWICAGYNGHGMALAWQTAEGLVQMLVGDDQVDEWFPNCYRLSRLLSGK